MGSIALYNPETFYRRGLPSSKIPRPKVTKKKLVRNVIRYNSLDIIPILTNFYKKWLQRGYYII